MMKEFACSATLSLAAECVGKEIKDEDVVSKCIADYAKQCNASAVNASVAPDNKHVIAEVECTVVEFVRSIGQLTCVLKQFGEVNIVYKNDKVRLNITVDLC